MQIRTLFIKKIRMKQLLLGNRHSDSNNSRKAGNEDGDGDEEIAQLK